MLTNVDGLTEDNVSQYKKISYSEMTSFNRCKRQWENQYLRGLKTPGTKSYFTKGTYLHKIMAEFLHSDDEGDVIFQRVRDTWDETEDNPLVFEDDVSYLHEQSVVTAKSIKNSTKSVVSVEQEFYVDIGLGTDGQGRPILFHGFIDAVIENNEGEHWLIEYKTASRAWSEDQFNFSTQDILYAAAYQAATGIRVAGVTYVFFLPKKLDNRARYYSPEMLNAAVRELQGTVDLRQMFLNSKTPLTYPRESLWGCGGCPFQAACRTAINGGDEEYILQTQFIVDEERAGRYAEAD